MEIGEVIRETVVAIFANDLLRESLVLKGGTSLRLCENIVERLSLDIDFSTEEPIAEADSFFERLGSAISARFATFEYDVIDAKYVSRPTKRKKGHLDKWSGWSFAFKLSSINYRGKSAAVRRRTALVPEGSPASTIDIQISEYEYCGSVETVSIDGAEVRIYSNILLILEKIRAICQQHPSYPYVGRKNRSRDYYDIYNLTRKHRRDENFIENLKFHLSHVFDAKSVNLNLLDAIFENEFVESQERDFEFMKLLVTGRLEPFPFYLEQLRILVSSIK